MAKLEAWQFGPCSMVQFESAKVQPMLLPKTCSSVGLGPIVLDPLIPKSTKPINYYNHKTKDNRFSKMDDSL
jgi:hypothetical protein